MSQADSSTHGTLLVTTIVLTVLAAVGAAVYLSGAGNDLMEWVAEKYFKAEAKAEEKALEHAGEGKAQDFMKGQLKKNPVVSNDELNDIQSGLGDEAAKEFGKGGLGKGIGKAFG